MYGKHQDEIRLAYLEKLVLKGFEIRKDTSKIYLAHSDFTPDVSGCTMRELIDKTMCSQRIQEYMEEKK